MVYEAVITSLREAGLIGSSDIAIVCIEAPSMAATFWGGAIGAAIAASKADLFIMSVNENEIRLFDVDKKTAQYLNTYISLPKADVISAEMAGALGSKIIYIKTTKSKKMLRYNTANTYSGHPQKENLIKLKEFFKANYSKKK